MHPVTIQFPAASGLLVGGGGCVTWHSSFESTGAASAQYTLWDGTAASGDRLMTITLSSGQSTRDYIHIHHMPYYKGLFWNLDSGAVTGNIIAQIDHNCLPYWRVEAAKLEAEYQALTAPAPVPPMAPSAANTPPVETLFQAGPNIPRQ